MKTYQETESSFSKYCKRNSINCLKLDFDLVSFDKSQYLRDINWKSPDFFCEKNEYKAFVEIKTFLKTQQFCDNIKLLKKLKNQVLLKDYLISWDVADDDTLNDISKKFENINNPFWYPNIVFFYMKFEEKDIFRKDLKLLRKKHWFSYRISERRFNKNIGYIMYVNYELWFFEIVKNLSADIKIYDEDIKKLFL